MTTIYEVVNEIMEIMRDTSHINFVSHLPGQVDYSGEFACGKTRSPIIALGDDKRGISLISLHNSISQIPFR